jgi:hypothetical protein
VPRARGGSPAVSHLRAGEPRARLAGTADDAVASL